MRFLLTGFQPFGSDTLNPSWEALKHIRPGQSSIELTCIQIPVSYASCSPEVFAAIDKLHPDAVICLGQAAGRSGITPERLALNHDNTSIPDNDGIVHTDRQIICGAPTAYFSTLPVKTMVKTMREADIPSSVSYSAGTYVCNHLMYLILHHLSLHLPRSIGGFIHLPCITEQKKFHPAFPCLPLETIVTGLEICLRETALYLEANR